MAARIVKVGIIGCGEVSQVIHIPNFQNLSDTFIVTYLCDVSAGALEHCKNKIVNPSLRTTKNAEELCQSQDVDVVFIASNDAYHVAHILLGLRYNKFVFCEKPMALSLKDAETVLEAEKSSSGRVMVGYMRRYAGAFLDAIKEIGGIGGISHATVRDILGPNSCFISQSGTFPKKFSDHSDNDAVELAKKTGEALEQALTVELGIPVNPTTANMWKHLTGLASHDLSAMRECLGTPHKVLGASICLETGPQFWSALFKYAGFAVCYESGWDEIPRFDASIEVFGNTKTVKICYDTPYVKGLPTTMVVRQLGPNGEYIESTVRKTYEDPFTLEMKELYEAVVDEKKIIKTTAADVMEDIKIFQMVMKTGYAQLL
ncbi:myo-inositol 2-dehydrogenase [Arthroderma uncinatum]|uniref:myo-inositol 2-dehydrogenase n=1 Tax=Arthroderma uncinatum TaxID=74035 RepID=UPI00144AA92E|nr:myo-inositol 2-dehydrogenase [Arthroderma uncinatum]KAF3481367.1 myo-inositol 2-dehydrogenase [Arthroderma uncinatum]